MGTENEDLSHRRGHRDRDTEESKTISLKGHEGARRTTRKEREKKEMGKKEKGAINAPFNVGDLLRFLCVFGVCGEENLVVHAVHERTQFA